MRVKINVDGAFTEQGKVGIGVVIRDRKGTVDLWSYPPGALSWLAKKELS
jgi:hypothetical protein